MNKCERCGSEIIENSGASSFCSKCRDEANKIALASLVSGEKNVCEPDLSPMVFDTRYSTKILLVRHGESLGNAAHIVLGHTDLDMSERGHRQAARTAELLKNEKIDVVYSSSLLRAYNTALPHARLRDLEVIKSDAMREMYVGEWENRSVAELIEEYGEIFTVEWRQRFGTFNHLKRGETVPALAERVYREVDRIARENVGKTVLIGTHAAALRAFWGKLNGTPPEDVNDTWTFAENASVSVVYFNGNELIPGEYSHSAHLADI